MAFAQSGDYEVRRKQAISLLRTTERGMSEQRAAMLIALVSFDALGLVKALDGDEPGEGEPQADETDENAAPGTDGGE